MNPKLNDIGMAKNLNDLQLKITAKIINKIRNFCEN